ncbi:MAG: TolC family protein [Bacteroidales bacterium]
MKAKFFLILFILSFLFVPGYSQDAKTWSLQQCIDYALTHNLDIKLQELNEEAARADRTQSIANLFPTLGAASYQGYNYGRTIDRFTNEFATERVLYQNLYGQSDLVLFSGFQNINNIRMHNARNTAFRYDTERLKNDIILAIAGAYLQILYHEDLVSVAREQMQVMNQQVERSAVLFEGGTLARSALLEVEAQQAQEQLNLLNAENDLRLSYLELVQLLDLDPEEEFAVESLPMDVDENFAFQSPQEAAVKALSLEPSVMAADYRVNEASKNVAMARGAYSPRLSFNAQMGSGYSEAARRVAGSQATGQYQQIGFTESDEAVYQEIMMTQLEKKPYRDQIKDNYNTTLSLVLNIPIFNRLQTRTRVSHARIDLEQARIRLNQTKNNVNKLIYQAHADAMASWQQYLSTEKSRESFEESFRFASQRFDQGMINAVEYNEARVRLVRSQVEALQAKYDFVFKSRILEFYQGEPLSF